MMSRSRTPLDVLILVSLLALPGVSTAQILDIDDDMPAARTRDVPASDVSPELPLDDSGEGGDLACVSVEPLPDPPQVQVLGECGPAEIAIDGNRAYVRIGNCDPVCMKITVVYPPLPPGGMTNPLLMP